MEMVQNTFIDSFNSGLRDERLNANWFLTIVEARRNQAWAVD